MTDKLSQNAGQCTYSKAVSKKNRGPVFWTFYTIVDLENTMVALPSPGFILPLYTGR